MDDKSWTTKIELGWKTNRKLDNRKMTEDGKVSNYKVMTNKYKKEHTLKIQD